MFVAGVAAEAAAHRDRQRARRPPATGSRGCEIRIHVSVLPAQPTVSRPSSSLSRLIRIVPSTSDRVEAVRALEPDLLGHRHQQLRAARAAATRPRRAPSSPRSRRRRRRRASSRSRSASRRRRRARSAPRPGSFGLSGSRSQTMSRCPWRTTVGAASRPGVAGTSKTRLRAASCRARSRAPSPQARTYSITGSSWRDGRAIVVSVSKCSQKAWGSSPVSTDVLVLMRTPSSGSSEPSALRSVPTYETASSRLVRGPP